MQIKQYYLYHKSINVILGMNQAKLFLHTYSLIKREDCAIFMKEINIQNKYKRKPLITI
jgi:hypothetical protein